MTEPTHTLTLSDAERHALGALLWEARAAANRPRVVYHAGARSVRALLDALPKSVLALADPTPCFPSQAARVGAFGIGTERRAARIAAELAEAAQSEPVLIIWRSSEGNPIRESWERFGGLWHRQRYEYTAGGDPYGIMRDGYRERDRAVESIRDTLLEADRWALRAKHVLSAL